MDHYELILGVGKDEEGNSSITMTFPTVPLIEMEDDLVVGIAIPPEVAVDIAEQLVQLVSELTLS